MAGPMARSAADPVVEPTPSRDRQNYRMGSAIGPRWLSHATIDWSNIARWNSTTAACPTAASLRREIERPTDRRPLHAWSAMAKFGDRVLWTGMKRPELLRHVLADCYCRLQPSPIHGIGVYAVRDIPKGRNPFKTFRKYSRPGYVRIADDELDALPPKLSGMIKALFVPTDGKRVHPHVWNEFCIPARIPNHSTAPNLRTVDGFNFRARRGIREGEELTVDYRTYGADELLATY